MSAAGRHSRALRRARAALLLAGAALLAGLPGAARAGEIVVGPGAAVRTLAEAVRQAAPGDRIVVEAGVYPTAKLVVDKPLQIVGRGWPVLDGGGEQILTVQADGVTLRGLVFRNVATSFVDDRAAVGASGVRRLRVEGNRFEDTFFGVYLARSSDSRVAGNVIVGRKAKATASANGIHVYDSRRILVERNRVRGHRDGVYLEFTKASEVRGNVSEGNFRYGLHFMFSDSCRYRQNVFRQNGAGVAVMYSRHVEMTDNRFERNWGAAAYGLLLKDITDGRITGNRFTRNTVGLYAEGSDRLVAEGNDFVGNGWAVRLMANSSESRFLRNNFVGNSFDLTTNSRQSYSVFEENYWDHYRGYDLDRDGYGDVPFRPVRLFSLLVERNEPALLMLRSFFVELLDAAERVLPALTPETLVDSKPAMRRIS